MTLSGAAMLAALVNPALFWGGAAVVAVPIVIHLLARRRFRRIRWAAMEFLIDAERHNRRRIRLEEAILLALRCLAVLLLVLLVARPFLRPSALASALGGGQRTDRIILIDDSLSMGYLAEGQTVSQRARTAILALLQRQREQAATDAVTILRSSQLQTPVVSRVVLDDAQFEQAAARLEAVEPTMRRLPAEAGLDEVGKLLAADAGLMNAALYIVSDFQRADWLDVGRTADGGGGGAGGLAAPLREWTAGGRALSVVLVDVGDDAAENLAISDVQPGQRQLVAGVESNIEATVSNFGRREVENLELQVTAGPQSAASARIDRLAPGQAGATGFPAVFTAAGDEVIRVEIPPDNLPADNARTLAVEVGEAIRILVVNGEASSDPYLDEVHLLTAALQPPGQVFSGNQVRVISDAELESTALEDYSLVVMANVYRVSEPAADALQRFVFGGGGLAILLGDQVADPGAYNATLFRDGEGLLPAALQSIIDAPAEGVTLAGAGPAHPVVRVFAGSDNPFLRRIRFHRYFAVDVGRAGDETAVEKGAPAAEGSRVRPAASVPARFDDAEQTPALIERSFGRGRVLLFNTSADLEWNDWGRDASYVVTMQEMAAYLARCGAVERNSVIGEPLVMSLDPARYEPIAVVRPPGYPQQQETEIAAGPAADGGLQIVWPQTEQAGAYAIILRGRDGTEVVRQLAVNPDPRESDLAPAREEELRQVFAGLPVEYTTGLSGGGEGPAESPRELWPLMLLAAVVVLMVEHMLAWRFGRR